MLISVYLCDGQADYRQQAAQMLACATDHLDATLRVSAFETHQDLLAHVEASAQLPDLVLMEIEPDLEGLRAANDLLARDSSLQVAFLTNNREAVFHVFPLSPCDYLLKDTLEQERMQSVLMRALHTAHRRRQGLFLCETKNNRRLLPIRDILYFEIWKRVIVAHMDRGGTVEFYGTLGGLESQFCGRDFARIHRSYLVNLDHILAVQPQRIQLRNGDSLPVGVTYTASVKRLFDRYLEKYSVLSL